MNSRLSYTLIFLVISLFANAQVAEYYFTQQNGTYTEITGGTELWATTFDNEVSGAVTIPSFTYDGTVYTSIYISANGFITFGIASAGNNYTPISSTAAYTGAVSAFGRDLNQAASGSPSVRYEQIGTEFVIQWKDVRRKDLSGEIISFQVRLNTSNNYIKVVYGGTITPGSNTTYPQVGLRGPDNTLATNVHNRTIASGGGNWVNSTRGTGNSNTMYFNSATPATVPSAGLTYTWKPLYNPTAFTAEAVSLTQIDLDWVKNSVGHNVMLAYNTANSFGTPVTGTVYTPGGTVEGTGTVLFYGNGTSFSHTSLSLNTVYYYKIWSYDAVPDYSPGVTASTRTGYALPYLQTFPSTSSPAEWSNNMSRAANHGTSLSIGQYERLTSSNTSCYAISPLVGTITSDTYLSFHYRFVNYLGFPLNATPLGPDDKLEIQVSTDDGATFTTIYTIDENNHTATTDFANAAVSLAAYSGDFIKVRFLCTWGSGDYYFDMDNVLFEDGQNMSYSTSTTEQPNTTNVGIGTTDNDIIRLQVVTQKSANPLYMNSISVTVINDAMVSAAKIFYSTTPVFSTGTQFGSTINNPSGSFSFSGSQVLAPGVNYFWLAYDIKPTATAGQTVDGQCSSFTTSESGTPKAPVPTSPTGSRTIGATFTGTKTIPGDYASIAAAVTALNSGVIGTGGVTFNVAGGHTESNSADIWLSATGTSSNP
ncbi:MAG: BNR-repeat neuraminidase N-terminal domain-containing protein, partial [Bacteroidales bacterium]|nr:BNR-repeat neuraminidase N-terminal domain-containing protein [Bacteroidales bacterium]